VSAVAEGLAGAAPAAAPADPTYPLRRALEAALAPLVALLAAFAAFAVFLLLLDRSPVEFVALVWRGAFGSWFSLQNTLQRASVAEEVARFCAQAAQHQRVQLCLAQSLCQLQLHVHR
jgi:hypothetical protein